jgi:hypothetical protein
VALAYGSWVAQHKGKGTGIPENLDDFMSAERRMELVNVPFCTLYYDIGGNGSVTIGYKIAKDLPPYFGFTEYNWGAPSLIVHVPGDAPDQVPSR